MRTICVIISMCTAVLSQTSLASASEGLCEHFGELAHTIMTVRQMNTPISKMMKVANAENDDDVADMLKQIILAAYEEPKWSGSENQLQAAAEFRNKVELECYQIQSK